MLRNALFVLIVLLVGSCDWMKKKTKDTINYGGEKVGQTATEFIEGVTEGVEKTLQCEVFMSEKYNESGITLGKHEIESSTGASNNILVQYLIFDKDIKTEAVVKAFDKEGVEIGRTTEVIEGSAGEAAYFEFEFDKRTHLGVRSKIRVE